MPTSTLRGSDFAPLTKEVRAHGLLERRPRRQGWSAALDLLLYGGVFAVVALVGDTWWQLLLAVPAAVLTTRIYFVGHDAGHGQLAATRRGNRLLGTLIGDLGVGLGHGWWTAKHNRHHANPNDVERDPDVGPGVLAWTPEQASARRGRFARALARHQGRLFFPLLLLEGVNLKVSSIRWVAGELAGRGGRCGGGRTGGPRGQEGPGGPGGGLPGHGRRRAGARNGGGRADGGRRRAAAAEAVLLTAHLTGYLGLLFAVMSPGRAVAFALVHHAVLGVHLGCAFAPNHKGMAMPGPDERWDHLRKQVLTSRNVRGGPVVDWFLGGLNHQIEHHLFPGMPRVNLRRARPLVRAHCARLGLPYTEEGLIASYGRALAHLTAAGSAPR